MASGPGHQKRADRFDLFESPFVILGIEPAESAGRIAEVCREGIAKGGPEAELTAARDRLLDLRQRLSAELAFPIDAETSDLVQALDGLRQKLPTDQILRMAERLAPLSKANLLAHLAARESANADLLFALIEAHARIDVRSIHARLEAVRKRAGLVAPDLGAVQEELRAVFALHAKAAIAAYPTSVASVIPIQACTKRALALPDAARMAALEGLLRAFGLRIEPELTLIEEQFRKAADALLARPREMTLVEAVGRPLRLWTTLTRPVLEVDAHQGRDEQRARLLFNQARQLSKDLVDKHQSLPVAQAVITAAGEVFELLAGVPQEVQKDLAALEEKTLEAGAVPLIDWIKRHQADYGPLVRELETSGFAAQSPGLAGELWTIFDQAVRRTQPTRVADLPWTLLRAEALAINNQGDSPLAAKALIEGMLKLSVSSAPSAAILSRLEADFRTTDRNARLASALQSKNTGVALAAVRERLADPEETPEQKQVLVKLERRLLATQWTRRISWVLIPVIGVAAILAVFLYRQPGAPPAKSVAQVEPAETSRPEPAPADTAPAVDDNPDDGLELKPAPGGDERRFSRANIRYCLFQEARMTATRAAVEREEELGRFSQLVEDYLTRCSSYRFEDRDIAAVRAELGRKAGDLAREGREVVAGWRRGTDTASPAAATAEPSPAAPQETTAESAPPAGVTLNPEAAADAAKIQAQLRDLGFYRGKVPAPWAAARAALRDFKVRAKLPADEVWDAETEQRLMAARPPRTPEELEAQFALTTAGTWAIDRRGCPGSGRNSDLLPLTINKMRAETKDGAHCDFTNLSGRGTGWKVVGTCVVNGETRKSNITLNRSGDTLTWSSENGTSRYLRCGG